MESHKAAIRKRLALEADPQIEAYVVFRNPVPIEFSWPETMPSVTPILASQFGTLRVLEINPSQTHPVPDYDKRPMHSSSLDRS